VLGRLIETYRAAFRGLPRDVWLLCLVALINRSGTMVLPFLSLYVAEECGLSVGGAGRVLAVYGLGAVAGSYLGGWLSDRIGSTLTQTFSLVTSGFVFLVFLLLDSAAEITTGAFLLSLCAESFRPAVMTEMTHRTPPELAARAFASLRLAVNVGMGIGPAIGGLLALYDYDWLFIVDAITCWLAAVILVATLGRTIPEVDGDPVPRAVRGRSPWRDGPFLLLMLLMTVLASVFFQVFSTLPLYFSGVYGLAENAIGLLLAFNAALIVAFEMVLIHKLEGRSKLILVGLGAFLICAGLGLMPFGSSILFVGFTIAIWTFGEMLVLPLTNVLVADRAGRTHRGRYMGLYTMTFSVAFVVAPAAGTWIYERFGPNVLWYGTGLCGGLLWLWALALRPAFRSRSEREPS
jgi:MFS family permease